jgi:NAD(P)-dependent dehydrogenase (short-subunit alcohol dehydrogenase family)
MSTIVLLTGAAGGLGTALAQQLRAAGVGLALVGRDRERLVAAHPTAESAGECLIEADVSTPEGAEAAVQVCTEALGRPDGLAHCAGTTLLAPLHRTRPEQYRACLRANLDSAFFTLDAFIKACRSEQGPGAAVLVSSVVAGRGVLNHEAIAAAKAGVEGLVRSAAATYAPTVRVNAIAPGLLETPATRHITQTENGRQTAARQYPLGRTGAAEDAAGLMAWLLSDQADWITGQVWAVDGGFSAIRPMVR